MKTPPPVTGFSSRVLVPVILSFVLIACGSNTQIPTPVTNIPGPSITPASSPDTPTAFPPDTQPVSTVSKSLPSNTPEPPSSTPVLLGAIQGKVTRDSSSGRSPISGASITVSGSPELATKTNADGIFFLPDLQPGKYTLVASASQSSNAIQVVQVLAGETIQADFPLIAILPIVPTITPATKGEIEGRVTLRGLDGVDRPVKGAPVDVAGWPALTATTNGDGQYDIRNLQPGQYYLIARTTSAFSSYVPVQVTAGVTGVADFPLLSILPGPPPTIQDENQRPTEWKTSSRRLCLD